MEQEKKEPILFYENLTKYAKEHMLVLVGFLILFFTVSIMEPEHPKTNAILVASTALVPLLMLQILPNMDHETIVTPSKLVLISLSGRREIPLCEIYYVRDVHSQVRVYSLRQVYFCYQGKRMKINTKKEELARILRAYGKVNITKE